MRDFLYSEIGNVHGIPNLPEDPDLAIAAGRHLCGELLEPLQATFGRLAIRSPSRPPAVNPPATPPPPATPTATRTITIAARTSETAPGISGTGATGTA